MTDAHFFSDAPSHPPTLNPSVSRPPNDCSPRYPTGGGAQEKRADVPGAQFAIFLPMSSCEKSLWGKKKKKRKKTRES